MIENNLSNRFVTIITVSYPEQLAVIRGYLEAEGIECFVQDELTVQVNPFYSNAVGGVKLQVRESDKEEACEILRSAGYVLDEDEHTETSPFMTKLDNITSKFPLLKRIRFEARLLIIITLLITIFVLGIYFIIRPSTEKRLTENSWCLDYVTYAGKNYVPKTTGFVLWFSGGSCVESITFLEDGRVTIPGFSSKRIYGMWHLDDKTLQISQTDTLEFIFDGAYSIKFSDRNLILESEKTTLHCRVMENSHLLPFLIEY